jgi:hypothetical protein
MREEDNFVKKNHTKQSTSTTKNCNKYKKCQQPSHQSIRNSLQIVRILKKY